MALSLSISITENSTNSANNTSNVTVALKATWNYGTYDWNGTTAKLTIDGTTYTQSVSALNPNGTSSGSQTLMSRTVNVSHNSDGSKTLYTSGSYSYWDGTRTASASKTLTKLSRYASLTQSVTSKTETSITIKWTADATISYRWYSFDDGATWTGTEVSAKIGTFTKTGLSPDRSYKIKTRVRRKDNNLVTTSSTLAVSTYNYPYVSSGTNWSIGDKATFMLVNPLNRTCTVTIYAQDAEVIGVVQTSGTSVSGFNDDEAVAKLYASIPNSSSGKCYAEVNYNGHSLAKFDVATYSVKPSVASPSFGIVSYEDTNADAVAITSDNQNIIRKYSTVRYSASELVAKLGASIKSVSVTVNSSTYNLTNGNGNWSGGNAIIDSGTDVQATFKVTDSRGLTASKSITIKMLNWEAPTAIINLARKSNFYDECDTKVDANVSSLEGKNIVNITYKAKIQGTDTYTVTGTLANNTDSVIVLDNHYAWEVTFTVTDRLGSSNFTLSVGKGIPLIFFDRKLSAVGINCFPTTENELEVNGVKFSDKVSFNEVYPVGSLMTTNTNTAPTHGTWTLIDKKFKNQVKTSGVITANSTNTSAINNQVACISDDEVTLILSMTTKVVLNDDSKVLGTVNWSNLGIQGSFYSAQGVAWTDGGNGLIMYEILASSGAFTVYDVVPKGTATTIAANNRLYAYITIPLRMSHKMDSACDRFIWKRTA